ncbi:hypothetical protein [Streptomyces sp. R02]|uniref:Uncharacterized protein n=1 Tax=Streptomyces sp. R02 TaxID=3238623 RepID=A0AB39LKH0_9ACTN
MDDADDIGDIGDIDDANGTDTGPPPDTRERLAHPTMKPPANLRRGL